MAASEIVGFLDSQKHLLAQDGDNEFADMTNLVGEIAKAATNGDAFIKLVEFRLKTRKLLIEQLKNAVSEGAAV